jgi:pyruvate formate lyase activating enzyme
MTPTTAATTPNWSPALLSAPGPDGRVRCELCPFRCLLADGRAGICAVRRNNGGQLETATMSVAAAHVDAVERKPLYHFRPGSRVLTVAAPGCTFRCDYCVNHRLSQFGRDVTAPWTGEPAEPEALVARAAAEGAAIGLSYSEPGLAPELTLELARLAGPHGIPVLWKSNGFLTAEAIDLVAPVLGAVNIDVKAAADDDHRRLTGAPLGPVLDAVAQFHAAGVWVEVSTPLIPGTADTIGALSAIARRIAAVSQDLPWHLIRFTPDYRMAGAAPTSPALLAAAVEAGRSAGLRFVYVERALGPAGRRTDCPRCCAPLIKRDVWSLHENLLVEGDCPACGLALPGIWR